MAKCYIIATERGDYKFTTSRDLSRKQIKESFRRVYQEKFDENPVYLEIVQEGLLDFFKKNKTTKKDIRGASYNDENVATRKKYMSRRNSVLGGLSKKIEKAVKNLKSIVEDGKDFLSSMDKKSGVHYNDFESLISSLEEKAQEIASFNEKEDVADKRFISGSTRDIEKVKEQIEKAGGIDSLSPEKAKEFYDKLSKFADTSSKRKEFMQLRNALFNKFGSATGRINAGQKSGKKMTKKKAPTLSASARLFGKTSKKGGDMTSSAIDDSSYGAEWEEEPVSKKKSKDCGTFKPNKQSWF